MSQTGGVGFEPTTKWRYHPHSPFFSKKALRNRDFLENLFYALLSEKKLTLKKYLGTKFKKT